MAKKAFYQQSAYGYPGPAEALFPKPIVSQRAPLTSDTGHSPGQVWVDQNAKDIYQLIENAGGLATWIAVAGGTADVQKLAGDAGGTISPTSGIITLAGGTKIATSGAGSTITFNLDAGTAAARSAEVVEAGNFLQSYASTAGLAVGTTYRAFRGDLVVVTGDGTESPQAIRANMAVNALGDVEEAYGGFSLATQADGSAIDSNLIGQLGMSLVQETDAADQPQQWVVGTQSIVSFDAAAAVPTASIVAGSLSHVTYDAPMDGIAHGYVASRNGGGAGSTAGSAYKVLIGGGIDDWTYGLDLYTGSTANNYSTADVRLSQQNTIQSGSGFPTATAAAGSLYIRSTGYDNDSVLYVNYDGSAGGWRPVRSVDSTWIENFTQSPIMQTNANTGGVPTGATGDINLMMMQGGDTMQQFIMGAGQTIIAPRMSTNGLLVSLDLVNTEGAEYNWGTSSVSKHAYTIGTDEAFAFILKFRVADVTGAEPILIGFRKQEANNGAYTNYTDYAAIGLINSVSAGNILIEDRLNSGVAVQTDTTDAWADGETHTLRVDVSSAGVVTYGIDGVAPTVTHAFTFDTGDVVMPFFHFLHGAAAPGAIEWVSMSCGHV